uniref:C-type lectin domain-containing protein n=1 Tax=Malurus cyaneus samueli TaxID=2593467 RepID=A0A8C5UED5_9PASS
MGGLDLFRTALSSQPVTLSCFSSSTRPDQIPSRAHPGDVLLLLLVLALLVSLAVVSGKGGAAALVPGAERGPCSLWRGILGASLPSAGGGHGETPVTPVTPVTADTPVLLACPHGWVGHRGICYFLSRDQLSWDQAQARCSELGASLAVLKDWEMVIPLSLTRNEDHWLGLRRRGRELQWGDGSNAGCVFLGEDHLRSEICSSEMPFICSRPQTLW